MFEDTSKTLNTSTHSH